MMNARLERHHKRPIGGSGSYGGERRRLGVLLSWAGVTRHGEEVARGADDGSANPGIGVGSMEAGGVQSPGIASGSARCPAEGSTVMWCAGRTSKLDPGALLGELLHLDHDRRSLQVVSMFRCWLVATPIDTETIG